MRPMDTEERDSIKDIWALGPLEELGCSGPWIGHVSVVMPDYREFEAIVLTGQNDNGDAVNQVIFVTDDGAEVRLNRLVTRRNAVELALLVESKRKVDILELGQLGFSVL